MLVAVILLLVAAPRMVPLVAVIGVCGVFSLIRRGIGVKIVLIRSGTDVALGLRDVPALCARLALWIYFSLHKVQVLNFRLILYLSL